MNEHVGTTYLGQRAGWDRVGVKIGDATYFILTRTISAANNQTIGCKVRLMSNRTYPTVDDGIDAALAAIRRLPTDPVVF